MSKVNDLLNSLDAAFDAAEHAAQIHAQAAVKADAAIAKKQAELDDTRSAQSKLVYAAKVAADDARAKLEGLRAQVNERIGTLTGLSGDPRVTVR